MGRFANELPGDAPCYVGVPASVREDWHGESGFEALGHKVPSFRKSAGDAHLKAMGFDNAERRWDIIAKASNAIERDDPHRALEEMFSLRLDATGCYRLLAVLLTAEEPPPPPPAPATFVDLVEARP